MCKASRIRRGSHAVRNDKSSLLHARITARTNFPPRHSMDRISIGKAVRIAGYIFFTRSTCLSIFSLLDPQLFIHTYRLYSFIPIIIIMASGIEPVVFIVGAVDMSFSLSLWHRVTSPLFSKVFLPWGLYLRPYWW